MASEPQFIIFQIGLLISFMCWLLLDIQGIHVARENAQYSTTFRGRIQGVSLPSGI